MGDGLLTKEASEQMDAEVVAEVLDAYDFADAAPEPNPEELWNDVYAPIGAR
jgi:TPP-dependent pyruvate/acetoin dehydrogenase alpha subunit